MRLNVSSISTGDSDNSHVVQLDVPESITLADLKALISSEMPAAPSTSQHLYYNGRLLADPTLTLEQCHVKDDDMLVVHTTGNAQASSSRQQGPQGRQGQHAQLGQSQSHPQSQQAQRQSTGSRVEYDPETIRLQVLANPSLQTQLRESNRELWEAVNDPPRFAAIFQEMERQKAEADRARQREIMLNEDPFNIESQQKIEELIRQEQVMENLQSALEHHPEVAFGRVTMLYVPVEVNGVSVKAFVDSGAQTTIMSPDCARRCGIMRLVDSRFSGVARGVGTAKIIGQVHSAQLKIGNLHLPCSFTVMEGKDVDLLLGLDMLKRHQAILDLKRGCLVIQGEEVEFLGESEIPKNAFGNSHEEPTEEGPSGSRVGGPSGAIIEPPTVQNIPQAGAAQSQHRQPEPVGPKHPEEMVAQLQGLGISREEAIAALDATGGNIDMAANLLFN